MSGRPHFLISLLIGSLTAAISITVIALFSKGREGPSENAPLSRSAPTITAGLPEVASDLFLPEINQRKTADHGGKLPVDRTPLDAQPANQHPVAVNGVSQSVSNVSSAFHIAGSSNTGTIRLETPSGLIEQIKIPSLPSSYSAAPGDGSGVAPIAVDGGIPQRKILLFAGNPPTGRFSPTPPPPLTPVFDTPNKKKEIDPNGGGNLSNPDDGAGVGDEKIEGVNTSPTADPGNDRTALVGDSVILDGSGSTDPDGDPLTFRWAIISSPTESLAFIANPSSTTTTFTADVAGAYIVQLVVDDGSDESLPQLLVITAELRGLTVPDVLGLSLAEARKVLTDSGLKEIRVLTAPNPEAPKNQVMAQQPAATSPVLEGTVVSLVISFPPQDDDDQDSLPDAWEYAKFGNLTEKGNVDFDGDGYTNYQEYLVGTDPADGTEAPVPAGNFFEYDAFGRILVKQITLEP